MVVVVVDVADVCVCVCVCMEGGRWWSGCLCVFVCMHVGGGVMVVCKDKKTGDITITFLCIMHTSTQHHIPLYIHAYLSWKPTPPHPVPAQRRVWGCARRSIWKAPPLLPVDNLRFFFFSLFVFFFIAQSHSPAPRDPPQPRAQESPHNREKRRTKPTCKVLKS